MKALLSQAEIDRVIHKINKNTIKLFEELSPNELFSIEIATALITSHPNEFKHAPSNFKNDINLVKIAIAHSKRLIEHASKQIKNNKEIGLYVIDKQPENLKFLSKELRNDSDIVEKSLKQSNSAFQYVSKELKSNRIFVENVLNKSGMNLKFVSKNFKNSLNMVLIAINGDHRSIEFASSEMKVNISVQLTLFQNNAYYFEDYIKNVLEDKSNLVKKFNEELKKQNQEYFIQALDKLDSYMKTNSSRKELSGIQQDRSISLIFDNLTEESLNKFKYLKTSFLNMKVHQEKLKKKLNNIELDKKKNIKKRKLIL